jgi:hypothetical protein
MQALVWVLFGYQGTPAVGTFTHFVTSLTFKAQPASHFSFRVSIGVG